MKISDPLRDLEPFDSSLSRRPVNVFELIAYILTYRDTILIRTPVGENVPIGKLPPPLAAQWVATFLERFQNDIHVDGSRWYPHRVPTDDLDRETMQHASWQVLALRDWAKVAKVWDQMKAEEK